VLTTRGSHQTIPATTNIRKLRLTSNGATPNNQHYCKRHLYNVYKGFGRNSWYQELKRRVSEVQIALAKMQRWQVLHGLRTTLVSAKWIDKVVDIRRINEKCICAYAMQVGSDQQVAGANPGLPAVKCNPGQVVNTCASPSSIIWYQPIGFDALGLER